MIEIDGDLIDDIIENNVHHEIYERFKIQNSITNYAVTCDEKLVCFTGSDIIDADNIRGFLQRKYTDRTFSITDEFMSFER